ncbi:MAG: radical SAM protein, partial [Firmicutes bacterium]|nr:radical SAM protein [Bacillota bacterium]
MQKRAIFRDTLHFLNIKRCRRRGIPPNSILFLALWVTNKCNLRCKMCDFWKTNPPTFSQELSTEEWYSVIDSAAKMHTRIIVITGGEPFLRPDIFQILGRIREKEMTYHICTSGTLLNRATIEKLKHSPPTSVTISLDSHRAEIHNELRGADCFDTVVEGIRVLKKNLPSIKIGINYLLCRQNFRDIERMVPFAKRLGVDQIKFQPIHTNLQHRHKPQETFGDLLFNKDDLPELRAVIGRAVLAASRAKLHTISSTFAK